MFLSDSIFKFLTRKGRNSKINNQLPEIAQVRLSLLAVYESMPIYNRGTQREYSSKPLKHSNVERILVFKR